MATEEQLRILAEKAVPGCTLLHWRPLHGGISYAMTAVDIRTGNGDARTIVVRVPSAELSAYDPQCIEDEFRLLEITRAQGLPTPTPLYLHRKAAASPANCMVLDYIEGVPAVHAGNPIDCAHQFAAHLVAIHRIDETAADIGFLKERRVFLADWLAKTPKGLDESLNEGEIRNALHDSGPIRPDRNGRVLLHGDFWPGNILWRDERIAGVIDWEEAVRGDPVMDVAITRLDLMWTYGRDAMDAFTENYRSLSGFDLADLPYWDLWAALRPMGALDVWATGWARIGRDDVNETTLRAGHREFVNAALEIL
ncbi:MAG: phosphotransferase [Gammaproteobacteria bacterium]|nr:phosphotransferase [Gammaproteobacteria bacterium]